MSFLFKYRDSDSSFVSFIYHTQSIQADRFISHAANQWEMAIMRQYGKSRLTIRGPETKAKFAPIPKDAEFLGIVFKPGVFMPDMPVSGFVDKEIVLPDACHHSFHLLGDSWEFPCFENADSFIARLIHQDLLVHDPIVDAVLQNQAQALSLRTIQRRFLKATGMTQGTFQQIERAHYAVSLLEQGVSILDTVFEAGYADQPHLTRSLKRFMGQTPAEITTIAF